MLIILALTHRPLDRLKRRITCVFYGADVIQVILGARKRKDVEVNISPLLVNSLTLCIFDPTSHVTNNRSFVTYALLV